MEAAHDDMKMMVGNMEIGPDMQDDMDGNEWTICIQE